MMEYFWSICPRNVGHIDGFVNQIIKWTGNGLTMAGTNRLLVQVAIQSATR